MKINSPLIYSNVLLHPGDEAGPGWRAIKLPVKVEIVKVVSHEIKIEKTENYTWWLLL